MYDFRVAKCLENGKIDEYAIFADGSPKQIIEQDEDGNKFFRVYNTLNNEDTKKFLRRSFTGRIKDAIETIRAGKGHALSVNKNPLTNSRVNSVVYFIDKKVGEEYRQKTLEGWKDTEFCYIIRIGNKNSFNSYILNKDREPITMFDEGDQRIPMRFDSYQKADQFMKDLIQETERKAKEFVNQINAGKDKEAREKIFNSFLDDFWNNKCKSKMDIKSNLFHDMIGEKGNREYIFYLKDIKEREQYYRVLQDVVENK